MKLFNKYDLLNIDIVSKLMYDSFIKYNFKWRTIFSGAFAQMR